MNWSLNQNDTNGIINCTPSPANAFASEIFTMEQNRHGAVILHIAIALYAFGAISIVCEYYFMSSIVAICKKCSLSEDVAGSTFMSIGTSAPEFMTACVAVFVTKSNVGLETVAGSTVFNMFFITAMVALAAPTIVTAHRWPVLRDLVAFIIVDLALMATCWDGYVTWYEAMIIIILYGLYIIMISYSNRLHAYFKKSTNVEHDPFNSQNSIATNYTSTEENSGGCKSESFGEKTQVDISAEDTHGLNQYKTLDAESQWTFPLAWHNRIVYVLFLPMRYVFWLTIPDCNKPGCWGKLYVLTFFASAAWLAVCCYIMVWMVEVIGKTFFIPEPVIGVTVLAIGTSVPDCLASVAAVKRGFDELAISNILGSNIFDLACTAFPWFASILFGITSSHTIYVGNKGVIFTFIAVSSSAVLLLLILMAMNWKLDKRGAVVILILYAIYVILTVLYEMNVFFLVNLPYCD